MPADYLDFDLVAEMWSSRKLFTFWSGDRWYFCRKFAINLSRSLKGIGTMVLESLTRYPATASAHSRQASRQASLARYPPR